MMFINIIKQYFSLMFTLLLNYPVDFKNFFTATASALDQLSGYGGASVFPTGTIWGIPLIN